MHTQKKNLVLLVLSYRVEKQNQMIYLTEVYLTNTAGLMFLSITNHLIH